MTTTVEMVLTRVKSVMTNIGPVLVKNSPVRTSSVFARHTIVTGKMIVGIGVMSSTATKTTRPVPRISSGVTTASVSTIIWCATRSQTVRMIVTSRSIVM
uniref:Uncharacterized protein n=1 Tax=Cacopsylla melanoneura TaxID=428564 RepID=A0A8D8XS21_9HEMI